ncbi:MAG: excinuclease ABC subunit UvrC [Pseudomonadota bacterium]
MSDAITFDAKAFLRTLTQQPGVYRMLNASDEVLYVGKAKNLRNRVSTYFTRATNARIAMMVAQIADIAITVTHTENEALILENNLIKQHRPRYNVLLRDDKSYAYLYLSADDYPRLSFHRGARRGKGQYFGPYPNSRAVRQTLRLLQKLIPVRQCENSYFANRSRPCLQYQIERCTAPCVGFISQTDYAQDATDTRLFLEGKASAITDRWIARMETAAQALDFEHAAKLRDQVSMLRTIQEKQYVIGEQGDLDIIAVANQGGVACIQLFYIRHGHNLGNKILYPGTGEGAEPGELISGFIAQHYLGKVVPGELLVNALPEDQELLEQQLSTQAGRKVRIRHNPRGERARWLQMAVNNAQLALRARLASASVNQQRVEALQSALQLDTSPQRMECFDISHTMGEQTVASCVVFTDGAPCNSDYRRYNITGIQGGDDYAAMRQALQRRYQRLQAEEGKFPDLLIIDGGKGQLHAAQTILQKLGISDLGLLGVAKGPSRKPGMEQLFIPGQTQPLRLPPDSAALHLIQHIRDEAHRFAITGHRQRRAKAKGTSSLEGIRGVGAKRRQRLLLHFGGLQSLSRAGVDDICQVKGISRALAEQIHAALHGST